MKLIKAHALGNDFLLARAGPARPGPNARPWRAQSCERHRGIGADGLIIYTPTPRGARDGAAQRRRQLLRSLGQRRALPGGLAGAQRGMRPGSRSRSRPTPASSGSTLLERSGTRYTFRASWGSRTDIDRVLARRRRRAGRRRHAARRQPAVRRSGRGHRGAAAFGRPRRWRSTRIFLKGRTSSSPRSRRRIASAF